MPDMLTHALVAFTLATLLHRRYDWISPPYVTAAMVGALVPDLMKLVAVIPSSVMAALYGLPVVIVVLHTFPGSIGGIAIGSLLVGRGHRQRVFLLAVLGATSHHALDLLLITHDGLSYHVLWPLTHYEPPTPQLYRSSDRWPALLATSAAVLSWYVVRWRPGGTSDT